MIIVNGITSNMVHIEYSKFSINLLQLFRRSGDKYLNFIMICFSHQVVDSYLGNEDDAEVLLKVARNILQIVEQINKDIKGIPQFILNEIFSLNEIFTDKLYGSEEALNSLHMMDLKRLYQGGELQKNSDFELRNVKKLGVLFGCLSITFCNIDYIWKFLEKLLYSEVNRFMIPALLGVLIGSKDILCSSNRQKFFNVAISLKNKINSIASTCNILAYQSLITQIETLLE
jgi:hypothetical protein